jgi:peptidoglycan/LPS O-acetylase OafA/YrhL
MRNALCVKNKSLASRREFEGEVSFAVVKTGSSTGLRVYMHDVPRRLHYLDTMRSIAAFCVVFYHWSHFFYDGTEKTDYDENRFPFYAALYPLYQEGYRAVQLFFCLSGFIFFWLYSQRITERKINLVDFGWLRFSRLYPLHLATLLFVLIGQWLIKANYGSFFVYEFNDAYHFVLQLFFISHWGIQEGWSFNGPVWSVSVEVLLYLVFALTCLAGFTRWWQLLVFVALGHLLTKTAIVRIETIGLAVIAFFCGGLAFKLFLLARARRLLHRMLWVWPFFCLLMWICVPTIVQQNFLYRWEQQQANLYGQDVFAYVVTEITAHLYEFFLFPLTLITLSLLEANKGNVEPRFAFLGEVSYSSYLLHFPLQMLFYGVAKYWQIDHSFFYSPVVLFSFFAILIPLSILTYRYFEYPIQIKLRKRLVKAKA